MTLRPGGLMNSSGTRAPPRPTNPPDAPTHQTHQPTRRALPPAPLTQTALNCARRPPPALIGPPRPPPRPPPLPPTAPHCPARPPRPPKASHWPQPPLHRVRSRTDPACDGAGTPPRLRSLHARALGLARARSIPSGPSKIGILRQTTSEQRPSPVRIRLNGPLPPCAASAASSVRFHSAPPREPPYAP